MKNLGAMLRIQNQSAVILFKEKNMQLKVETKQVQSSRTGHGFKVIKKKPIKQKQKKSYHGKKKSRK